MRALVLESFVGSSYSDTPDSYEFPRRYLKLFDPLARGETIVAVIYEPRGDRNEGRLGYVGWTLLQEAPQATGRTTGHGEDLYRVRYADRYREFDRVVLREATGEPIETWLRSLPRGRPRNVATLGRAVRRLMEPDLETILALGFPAGVDRAIVERGERQIAEVISLEDRARHLVSAVQREARFRDEVLQAYGYQCAVSGLAVGTVATRADGLVDAAHIRPVGRAGADVVPNGLALTPTLHRLFDKGLFTFDYRGTRLLVRTSPRLTAPMITGRDGFALALADGLEAALPTDALLAPSRDALSFYQSEVFVRG